VLKKLSAAMLVVTAVVENQIQFMNMLLPTVLSTPHANNTMLTILSTRVELVNQLTSAKTAHGHHAQLDKHAKTNVGPSQLRSITSATTTVLLEPLK
jgi:hypothetical protein